MASYNKVILLGNLTRDPELKYTPKGTGVARLGLAVNRRWTGEDGQPKEEVTFIDIDAFGKQAEVISQYFRKGSPLFLEGRLKLDQWDDKNTGQKVSKLRVVLERFEFVGGQRGSEGGAPGAAAPMPPPSRPAPSRPAPSSQPSAPAAEADAPPPEDDDVPF